MHALEDLVDTLKKKKNVVGVIVVVLYKHTDTACILDLVNIYCNYKEAGRLNKKTRQRLANNEVWNFFKLAELTLKHLKKHPWLPNHRPPLTPPLVRSHALLFQLFFFFFLIN